MAGLDTLLKRLSKIESQFTDTIHTATLVPGSIGAPTVRGTGAPVYGPSYTIACYVRVMSAERLAAYGVQVTPGELKTVEFYELRTTDTTHTYSTLDMVREIQETQSGDRVYEQAQSYRVWRVIPRNTDTLLLLKTIAGVQTT